MKRLLLSLALLSLSVASYAKEPPPRALPKATVLPLALDDAFQFRKTVSYLNDPELQKPSFDAMIQFERQYINYGAINGYERKLRYGHYFRFFWRADRKADLTIRFEYRQQNLGALVQAKEYTYNGAKGSYRSEFDVIGNDYNDDGKITGWRVLMIENGKIVGLSQSFLWN
jgi:hypothetical protein